MCDSIKVVVRVRPLIRREDNANAVSQWTVEDKQIKQNSPGSRPYCFDQIFDQPSTTENVYDEVAVPIVHSVMQGFNGTIFAYGQTASGKTFTMMGNERNPGIIPRAIHEIFEVIESEVTREFLIRVSYMEIYNENVLDLLAARDEKKNLEVREDTHGQVFVANLKEVHVNGSEHIISLMKAGEINRHFGVTNMNERSSRSHTIFRLIIEGRDRSCDPRRTSVDGAVNVAHLNLVDLAGSEKARQTGAKGQRLAEGGFINKSLFTLGQVISQLSDESSFISYRDSKLTRILKNALGGNSKTVIISNVTPAAVDETHSTLRFSTSAKRIKNKPVLNEILSDEALLKRYKQEIEQLKHKLSKHKNQEQIDRLEDKEREQMEKIESLRRYILVSSQISTADIETNKKIRRQTWCPGKARQSFRHPFHKLDTLGFQTFTSTASSLPGISDTLCEGTEDEAVDMASDVTFDLDNSAIASLQRKNHVTFAANVCQEFPSVFPCAAEEFQNENCQRTSSVSDPELTSLQTELRLKDQQISDLTLKMESVLEKNQQIQDLRDQIKMRDSAQDTMSHTQDSGFDQQVALEQVLNEEISQLRQQMAALQSAPVVDGICQDSLMMNSLQDTIKQLESEKTTASAENAEMCSSFFEHESVLMLELDSLRTRLRDLEATQDVTTAPEVTSQDANIAPEVISQGVNTESNMISQGVNTEPNITSQDANTSPEMSLQGVNTAPDMISQGVNTEPDMTSQGVISEPSGTSDVELLAKISMLEEANERLKKDHKLHMKQIQEALEDREEESKTLSQQMCFLKEKLETEQSKQKDSGSSDNLTVTEELRNQIHKLEDKNLHLEEESQEQMELLTMKICQLESDYEELQLAQCVVNENGFKKIEGLESIVSEMDVSNTTVHEKAVLNATVQEKNVLNATVQEKDLLNATVQEKDVLNVTVQEKDVLSLQESDVLNATVQGMETKFCVSAENEQDRDVVLADLEKWKSEAANLAEQLAAKAEELEKMEAERVSLLDEFEIMMTAHREKETESTAKLERLQNMVYTLQEQNENLKGEFSEVAHSEMEKLRAEIRELEDERLNMSLVNVNDADTLLIERDMYKSKMEEMEAEHELVLSQQTQNNIALQSQYQMKIMELESILADRDIDSNSTDQSQLDTEDDKLKVMVDSPDQELTTGKRDELLEVISMSEELIRENSDLREASNRFERDLMSSQNEVHKLIMERDEIITELEELKDFTRLETEFKNISMMEKEIKTSPPLPLCRDISLNNSAVFRSPRVALASKKLLEDAIEEQKSLSDELKHLRKALKGVSNEKNDLESLLEMEKQKFTRRERELREQLEQAYSELRAAESVAPPADGQTDQDEVLKTMKAKLTELQSEIDSVRDEKIHLQKELDEQIDMAIDNQKDLAQQQEIIRELKAELSDFEKSTTLTNSDSDLALKVSELQKEREQLIEQFNQLKWEKSSIQSTMDKIIQANEADQSHLEDIMSDRNTLQREKDQLLEQLKQVQTSRINLDETIEKEANMDDELKNIAEERERLLEEKTSMLEQLQSQSNLQKENECLMGERNSLLEQLQSLAAQQQNEDDSIEALSTLASLKKERHLLLEQLDQVSAEKKSLQEGAQKVSELEKQLFEATQELCDVKDVVGTLKNQLTKSARDSMLPGGSETYLEQQVKEERKNSEDLRVKYEKLLAQSNQTQGKLLSEENRDLDQQKHIDVLEKNRKDAIENFSRLNTENQAIIDKLNKEVYELRCQLQKSQVEQELACHRLKKTEEDCDSFKQELRILEDLQMKHEAPRGRQELDPDKMADRIKKMSVSLDLTNQRCQKAEAKAKELEVIARKAEDAMFTRDHLQRQVRDFEQIVKENQAELSAVQQRYSGSYAEIAQIKSHASSLQDALNQEKSNIVRLGDEIKTLESEREQLTSQRDQEIEELKLTDVQRADYKRKLDRSDQKYEDLAAQLQSTVSQLDQMQLEKQQTTDLLTKLEAEKVELANSLHSLKQEKRDVEDILETMKNELLDERSHHEEVETGFNDRLAELERHKQELIDSLNRATTKHSQSSAQHEELLNKLEKIQMEKEQLTDLLDELKAEKIELFNSLQSHKQHIVEGENMLESVRRELSDERHHHEELETTLTEQLTELEKYKQKLAETLNMNKQEEVEVENSLESVRRELSDERRHHEELETTLTEQLNELEKYKQELADLLSKHKQDEVDMENMLESVRRELSDERRHCEELETTLTERLTELEKYKQELADVLSKMADLDNLQSENQRLMSNLTEIEHQKVIMTRQEKGQITIMEEFQREKNQMMEQLKEVSINNEQLLEQLTELKREKQDLIKHLTEKDEMSNEMDQVFGFVTEEKNKLQEEREELLNQIANNKLEIENFQAGLKESKNNLLAEKERTTHLENQIQIMQMNTETEMKNLEFQKSEALKRISETEEKLQILQAELEKAQRESVLSSAVSCQDEKYEELLKENAQVMKHRDELYEKLQKLQSKGVLPNNTQDNLQSKYKLLQYQYDDLLKIKGLGLDLIEKEELMKTIQSLKVQIQHLERVSVTKDKGQKLQAGLEKVQGDSLLSSTVPGQEQNYEELQNENAQIKKHRDEFYMQIQKLEFQLDEQYKSLDDLQAKYDDLLKVKGSAELEKVQRESVLSSTMPCHEESYEELLKENAQIKIQMQHLEMEKFEALKRVSVTEDKCQKLQAELEKVQQESVLSSTMPCHEESYELQNKNARIKKHRDELHMQTQKLEFELDEQHKSLDDLQAKYDQLKDKHDDLLKVKESAKLEKVQRDSVLSSTVPCHEQQYEELLKENAQLKNQKAGGSTASAAESKLQADLDSVKQENFKQMLQINKLETELCREAQPLKDEIASQKETISYLEERLQQSKTMMRKVVNEQANTTVLCPRPNVKEAEKLPKEDNKPPRMSAGSGVLNSLKIYELEAERETHHRELTKMKTQLQGQQKQLAEMNGKIKKYKAFYKQKLEEEDKSVLRDMVNSPQSTYSFGFDSWRSRESATFGSSRNSSSTNTDENWLSSESADKIKSTKCPQQ